MRSPSIVDSETKVLKQLLYKYGYQYREEPFKLKSGGESHHYIDCRPVLMSFRGATYASACVMSRLDKKARSANVIAGVVLGAVPLVDEIVTQYAFSDVSKMKAYVRPEPKGHGSQNLVEMDYELKEELARGGPVSAVLVEDVWTTGGSARKAKEALQSVGIEVALTVALVDRSVDGVEKPDVAIFTLSELLYPEGEGGAP